MSGRSAGDDDDSEFSRLGRIGFFAKGVLYVLLGVVTARVAAGGGKGSDGQASQEGALRTLAEQSFGEFALWFLVAGLASYGVWRLIIAWRSPEAEDPSALDHLKRIGYFGVGVVYLGLGYQAFQVVRADVAAGSRRSGSSGSSSGSEKAASTLIDSGLGQIIVVIVAVVLVVLAVRFVLQGLSTDFLDDELERREVGDRREAVLRWSGAIGHVGRGVSFLVVAWFLLDAVIGYEPDNAVGLDGALSQLSKASYGPLLLWLVAFGFASYGVYAIVASPDKTVDEGV